MKKKIALLLMCSLLVSCNGQSNTNIQVGSVIDSNVEQERNLSESEIEKERLDKEYRQTDYLTGFDETHARLKREFEEIAKNYFDEHVTTKYVFSTELILTNVGYQRAKDNNLSIMSLVNDNPDEIIKLKYDLVLYVNEFLPGGDSNDGIKISLNYYSREDSYQLYNEFNKILMNNISIVDGNNNNYQSSGNSTLPSVLNYFYSYYLNDFNGLEYLFPEDDLNLIKLREKYKEEFIRIGTYYLPGCNDYGVLYAPKRNLNIRFEIDMYGDKYRASIFQYLMSQRIEKLLDEYELRDKVGYFVSAENHDVKGNTSSIEFTDEQLGDLTDKINLTLYYLVDKDETEDLQMLIELLRGIYKDTDKVTLTSVMTYVYEISGEDKKIALKLLDEAKISQNFVEEEGGIETWAQDIKRTRNDADAFKFLDVYGVKRDYLYDVNFYVDDDYNVEDLLKRKVKSRFE